MSFQNITLAMDLSLTSPGFAILATENNGRENLPIVLESSFVTTTADQPMGQRLMIINDEIERLIKAYSPEHVVREKGFSFHAQVTQSLFRVVGISDFTTYVLTGKEVPEITPSAVKKAVTGAGKATKQEVADAVFRILQITNTDEYHTDKGRLLDDKTDALAVGIAYLKQKGLIK